jgi:acyl carrier protein
MASAESLVLVLLDELQPALHRVGRHPATIEGSLNLVESGLLDSIAFLQLLATLERRTGVELNLFDIDPEDFTTIDGLLTLLERASNQNSSP